jgi:hypothetical protein
MSLLDDYKENLREYRYIYYILYKLKINKDLTYIKEYRNRVSIFGILINRSLRKVYEKNSKINKYAYNINYIYKNVLVSPISNIIKIKEELEENEKDEADIKGNMISDKRIYDYDSLLINSKIIKMKKSTHKSYGSIFRIYIIKVELELDDYLEEKVEIMYLKMQKHIKWDELE